VEKASKSLKKLANTEIVEFKTYVREDAPNVHAHLFEPLYAVEKITVKGKEVEGERILPEHYISWEKRFAWTEQSIKDVVVMLTDNIVNLGEVIQRIHGRNLCFYRGEATTKSIFAALLLGKKSLSVRIRTDPATFRDPQKWTGDRIYKGWFFKQGQEREFKIASKEQIPYAMELIKQSYDISDKQRHYLYENKS
jgi:predicted transport protein